MAPLRAQPSDKSEMVSQLLFGETVEIEEKKDNWRYVGCSWDGYTGWVDTKQLHRLTPSEYEAAGSTGHQSVAGRGSDGGRSFYPDHHGRGAAGI